MSDSVVYYRTPAGACPVAEFLDDLSDRAAAKCLSYIDRLLDPGPPFMRNIAEAITGYPPLWELKPEWAGVEYRIFFAQVADAYVLLHAVVKKRRRLPNREFETAIERLQDYRRRNDP